MNYKNIYLNMCIYIYVYTIYTYISCLMYLDVILPNSPLIII